MDDVAVAVLLALFFFFLNFKQQELRYLEISQYFKSPHLIPVGRYPPRK